MCTCIAMHGERFLFGRNMDIDRPFGERVVVRPRGFVQAYKRAPVKETGRYAMIGMAAVSEGVPLYAEACNEKGVCAAALNFPDNAHYFSQGKEGETELAPYELIPWILERCETAVQAMLLLKKVCLVAVPFNDRFPLAPLHWMIADKKHCFVAEPLRGGLRLYENPVRVLTNNPPFSFHLQRLNDFMNIGAGYPENRMAQTLNLRPYSQGMGGIGLPGDASSCSRFVRAAFFLHNGDHTKGQLSQFFHVLSGVEMPCGSVKTKEGACDYTTYACCMDTENSVYYYRSYSDHRINAVRLSEENSASDEIVEYDLKQSEDILFLN